MKRIVSCCAFLVLSIAAAAHAQSSTREALIAQLDREFGVNAVARGRAIFAATCAQCHSSQPGPWTEATDFHATVEGQPDLRLDFLSNERPIPVTQVGTSRSRALHSNHMKGHVWDEYGSETPQVRAARLLGWVDRGGPIEYVMTRTGAEPVTMRTGVPLDYDHYRDRQLVPIAQAIANVIGADTDGWFNEPGQLGLFT